MFRFLRSSWFCFGLIFLLAAAVRLYRLPEYIQFLGDEGRDALIVKRMIVDGKLTLLGPTASVGGFYVGGLYYYFMLPFLWLWRLDPVGPAYMTVLFGLGTIILLFLVTRYLFGPRAGLIAAFLAALSPRLVYISRFSWNPNPMPFFSLAAIFFLILAATKRNKSLFVFLAGVMVGVLLELHYMSFIFVLILFPSVIALFPNRSLLGYLILAGLGLVVGNAMFILYEFRHQFQNTLAVWEFVSRSGRTVAPRSLNLLWLVDDMSRRLFETVLGQRGTITNLVYYSGLAAFVFWVKKNLNDRIRRPGIVLLSIWLLIGILGIGSYRGQLFDHYFGLLYPLPFILLGLFIVWLAKFKKGLLALPLLVVLVILEVKGMFFWQPPNHVLEQTKRVASLVLELSQLRSYNFALLAEGNSDYAYRYFLEIWGFPPMTIKNPQIDPKRETVTDQLIVVCEQVDCQPLGHPLWEIAGFGRAEILDRRDAPGGIVVYKLVHYRESEAKF